MALVCVKTSDEPLASKFFMDVNKRLQEKDILKNAFKGKVLNFGRGFFVVNMSPVYPSVYIIGFIYLVVMFVFFRHVSVLWLLPGLIILGTGFFYSPVFFYLMLRRGLRKAGYKGEIKVLTSNGLLKRL